ncbi:DEAD/DEAH box helicase [Ktedonospora formicarum]|uniref:AAA+ ATPase domain-containing protein n=1 Tax=Ktedonospora formicarum TaxID=2778364 RepID=A0A8J3MZ53_9CHLR|nr:AAA domain-containing protein [Ktedonospora formicarum]GHO51448.1 hypothetical protein KSX_96110 [Ktedonospora formicarum]
MATSRPQKPPSQEEVQAAVEKVLDLVIASLHKARTYPVSDGTYVGEEGRRYKYCYHFQGEETPALNDGIEVQICANALDEDGIAAQLVGVDGETMTLVVSRRLDVQLLASAQVIVDRARLYRKLKEAFLRAGVPAELDRKLLGELPCDDLIAAGEESLELLPTNFSPDGDQRQAMLRALASEVTMVLGPPGTGKTSVLAAIAYLHALYHEYRVLILSHTNVAIDNAIERLVDLLHDAGRDWYVEQQRVIRFGIARLPVFASEAYQHVAMEQVVESYLMQTQQEEERLQERCQVLRERIREHRQTHDQRQRKKRSMMRDLENQIQQVSVELNQQNTREAAACAEIDQRLAPLCPPLEAADVRFIEAQLRLREAEADVAAAAQQHQEQQTAYGRVQKLLEIFRARPVLSRLFRRVVSGESEHSYLALLHERDRVVETCWRQLIACQHEQKRASVAVYQAQREHGRLRFRVDALEAQREQITEQYQTLRAPLLTRLLQVKQQREAQTTSAANLRSQLQKWEQELQLTQEMLAKMDEAREAEKRRAIRKILENAQVVGATLTTLYLNPLLLEQEWDVIIIDEGSMAPVPAVLVAARRAIRHLIIIGDPLQLAPVCSWKEPLIKHWLGLDIFAHGGYSLEEARTGAHHSALLSYQGRMSKRICDLIRHSVYQGALKDRLPDRPLCAFGPDPEHPVVLLDTTGAKNCKTERPKAKSRLNVYHAAVVTHQAQQVLACMEESGNEAIGVITPYTLQRDLLKERFAQAGILSACRIGTIHAFQGMEFDVVILDLVDTPSYSIAPFLCGGWGSEAMRMVNVAVTRARHKLYIVAHVERILRTPDASMLQQLVRDAGRQHRVRVRRHFVDFNVTRLL